MPSNRFSYRPPDGDDYGDRLFSRGIGGLIGVAAVIAFVALRGAAGAFLTAFQARAGLARWGFVLLVLSGVGAAVMLSTTIWRWRVRHASDEPFRVVPRGGPRRQPRQ